MTICGWMPSQSPVSLTLLFILGHRFRKQPLVGCVVHTQEQKLTSTGEASVQVWTSSSCSHSALCPQQILCLLTSLHLNFIRSQPFIPLLGKRIGSSEFSIALWMLLLYWESVSFHILLVHFVLLLLYLWKKLSEVMATPDQSKIKGWVEWGQWKYSKSSHSFYATMKGCRQLCDCTFSHGSLLFISLIVGYFPHI